MPDMNERGLPAYCYAIAPKTGLPVRIFRGEHADPAQYDDDGVYIGPQ